MPEKAWSDKIKINGRLTRFLVTLPQRVVAGYSLREEYNPHVKLEDYSSRVDADSFSMALGQSRVQERIEMREQAYAEDRLLTSLIGGFSLTTAGEILKLTATQEVVLPMIGFGAFVAGRVVDAKNKFGEKSLWFSFGAWEAFGLAATVNLTDDPYKFLAGLAAYQIARSGILFGSSRLFKPDEDGSYNFLTNFNRIINPALTLG